MRANQRRRGSTMVEFSLAGIPAIFLLISAIQMALGMWQYHTLAFAIKEGTRFASVRGIGCAMSGNSCSTTVGAIATNIASTAIGIPPAELNVMLTSASGSTLSCAPVTSCYTNATVWPPAAGGDNMPGQLVTVSGKYVLHSAMAMFWPGTKGAEINTAAFSASSSQPITF